MWDFQDQFCGQFFELCRLKRVPGLGLAVLEDFIVTSEIKFLNGNLSKLLKYKKIYKKEIEKNLIKKLAKFKIPKKIFFLGKNISMIEIPKTSTNKIHYKVLQKVLANEK